MLAMLRRGIIVLKTHTRHGLNILLSLLLFSVIFAFAEYLATIEHERLDEVLYSKVLLRESAVRAQLESELNATLHITTGLAGYIAINPGLAGKEDVQKVLATLFKYGHHLRNIGLAPDNIITHIYPIEGNENALGLHYQQHPLQWPAVKRAIESRSTVLAGPVNLVQGGRGLISRTPVFLDDGRYWGIISLVIDIDSLVSSSGLMSENNDVAFALRGKDGLGRKGELFMGRAELFQDSPILLNLSIPGGQWQLAAAPKAGWHSNHGSLKYYHIVGFLVALMLSVMLWVILNDRWKIQYLALHDALTGLPNRRLFGERLDYTLAQKQRQQQAFSLLSVDLDNLKPINDQLGHKVGDLVLRQVAQRMLHAVRHEDTVARVGGDEFMIILPSTGKEKETLHVAQQLLETVQAPVFHHGEQLDISASIGISLYPEHGSNEEELLRAADLAMYQAKKAGKGRIFVHNS